MTAHFSSFAMSAGDVNRSTADPAAEGLSYIEMGHEAGVAEYRLWLAALALLVRDAKGYWLEKKTDGSSPEEREEAFDAVCDCTWMLKRICSHTGHDPLQLSLVFIGWCESVVCDY